MPGRPFISKGEIDTKARPTWRSINASIVAAGCSDSPDSLLAVIDTWAEEMNLVNLATSWHRLARIIRTRDAFLQLPVEREESAGILFKLVSRTDIALRGQLQRAGGFDKAELRETLKSVSNIAWALGVVMWCEISLMHGLVQWHETYLDDFLPFEVGSSMWAFSRSSQHDPACEALTSDILIRGSQHLAQLVYSKIGIRTYVMVSWACAVRNINRRLTIDIFLPRLKKMLRCAEVNCEMVLELIEAFWMVCPAVPRKKFCWNDILECILRSLQSRAWPARDVVQVTSALLRCNVNVQELAAKCQQFLANGNLSTSEFLQVVRECCLPTSSPETTLANPVLRSASGQSISALLSTNQFPWHQFSTEELVGLTALMSSRLTSKLQRESHLSYSHACTQAEEFLRIAAGHITHNLGSLSGDAVAQLVVAHAPLSFAGDQPVHAALASEVCQRLGQAALSGLARDAVLSACINAKNQAYQAVSDLLSPSPKHEDSCHFDAHPAFVPTWGRQISLASTSASRPWFYVHGAEEDDLPEETLIFRAFDASIKQDDPLEEIPSFRPFEASIKQDDLREEAPIFRPFEASMHPDDLREEAPIFRPFEASMHPDSETNFFKFQSEQGDRVATLDFVLWGSTGHEVSDFRLQYQYYGLV